jgi:opacity protein-like surface antigen
LEHLVFLLSLRQLNVPTMKKGLLVAAVLFAALGSKAQINKGQFLAGGTAGFSSSKYGENKTTNINVTPGVGYFVIDKLAVGAEATYGYAKETSETTVGGATVKVESKVTSLAFAPFVRYYFLPAAQKVNVFAHGSYGFGSTKVDDGDSQSFSAYHIGAGPAFFLTPSVALEATVYYNSSKVKDAPERTNTFGLSVGFQVHLGKGKK